MQNVKTTRRWICFWSYPTESPTPCLRNFLYAFIHPSQIRAIFFTSYRLTQLLIYQYFKRLQCSCTLWGISILIGRYKKSFNILVILSVIAFNKFLKHHYSFMQNGSNYQQCPMCYLIISLQIQSWHPILMTVWVLWTIYIYLHTYLVMSVDFIKIGMGIERKTF